MFVFLRPVRFADVDAARIVFFARYLEYCHDALEALFAPLPGGYSAMINDRDVGVPSVRIEVDYRAPLRYGDTARICVQVEQVGTTSCTFRYDMYRAADGTKAASVRHVVVHADLQKLAKLPFDAELRALLEAHLVPAQATSA